MRAGRSTWLIAICPIGQWCQRRAPGFSLFFVFGRPRVDPRWPPGVAARTAADLGRSHAACRVWFGTRLARDAPIPAVFSFIDASVHRRASFATMDRDQARSPRIDGVSTGRPFGFRGHFNVCESPRLSPEVCGTRERFQTRQIPVDQRQLLERGFAGSGPVSDFRDEPRVILLGHGQTLRIEYPGAIHHVMSHGNLRRSVFE